MRATTKERQQDIRRKPYLTINDIYEYLPIGKKQASKIFHQIEEEMKFNKEPIFNTRPKVVSAKYFFSRYH